MTDVDPDKCSDKNRENIPWYLNGTLSDSDALAVREHIENCADCRADVELHSSMRASVLGRELTPMMPATKAADIIDGDDRPQRARKWRTPSRMTAVAAGIAIFGTALVALFYADQEIENPVQIFETATSPSSAANIDYVLQLRFEDGVAEEQRIQIAEQLQGIVKWNVNEFGDFEIHVQLAAPSLETLELYEKHADSIAGVQSAKFIALQLPMR